MTVPPLMVAGTGLLTGPVQKPGGSGAELAGWAGVAAWAESAGGAALAVRAAIRPRAPATNVSLILIPLAPPLVFRLEHRSCGQTRHCYCPAQRPSSGLWHVERSRTL